MLTFAMKWVRGNIWTNAQSYLGGNSSESQSVIFAHVAGKQSDDLLDLVLRGVWVGKAFAE